MKAVDSIRPADKTKGPKKTYQEIFTFGNVGNLYLGKNKEENKFRYALRRVIKSCMKLMEGYNDKMEEINIKYCSVDPDTDIILKDKNNSFEFTKDNLTKRNAERKKLNETSVVIDPYMAQDVPSDITDIQRDAFAGFVLPEGDVDQVQESEAK